MGNPYIVTPEIIVCVINMRKNKKSISEIADKIDLCDETVRRIIRNHKQSITALERITEEINREAA